MLLITYLITSILHILKISYIVVDVTFNDKMFIIVSNSHLQCFYYGASSNNNIVMLALAQVNLNQFSLQLGTLLEL